MSCWRALGVLAAVCLAGCTRGGSEQAAAPPSAAGRPGPGEMAAPRSWAGRAGAGQVPPPPTWADVGGYVAGWEEWHSDRQMRPGTWGREPVKFIPTSPFRVEQVVSKPGYIATRLEGDFVVWLVSDGTAATFWIEGDRSYGMVADERLHELPNLVFISPPIAAIKYMFLSPFDPGLDGRARPGFTDELQWSYVYRKHRELARAIQAGVRWEPWTSGSRLVNMKWDDARPNRAAGRQCLPRKLDPNKPWHRFFAVELNGKMVPAADVYVDPSSTNMAWGSRCWYAGLYDGPVRAALRPKAKPPARALRIAAMGACLDPSPWPFAQAAPSRFPYEPSESNPQAQLRETYVPMWLPGNMVQTGAGFQGGRFGWRLGASVYWDIGEGGPLLYESLWDRESGATIIILEEELARQGPSGEAHIGPSEVPYADLVGTLQLPHARVTAFTTKVPPEDVRRLLDSFQPVRSGRSGRDRPR